jgi:hypothetical protein
MGLVHAVESFLNQQKMNTNEMKAFEFSINCEFDVI